ncbi:hypothetical protein SXCC_02704 [Gluconacetobacter sp. SXCC-1]|nr:hypothetical protein SXCC_02704 [Gluconacetobacter sp. SXCC-1]
MRITGTFMKIGFHNRQPSIYKMNRTDGDVSHPPGFLKNA